MLARIEYDEGRAKAFAYQSGGECFEVLPIAGETVRIYRLIAHGTIDERISKVLGGKIDLQKLILDEIKGETK